MFVVFLCLTCAFLGGWAFVPFGMFWPLLGAALGFNTAIWALQLVLSILDAKESVQRERGRPHPLCRHGVCGSDDYEIGPYSHKHDGVILRCRCGDTYVVGLEHMRFLPEGGSPEPYMKRSCPGEEWEPDTGGADSEEGHRQIGDFRVHIGCFCLICTLAGGWIFWQFGEAGPLLAFLGAALGLNIAIWTLRLVASRLKDGGGGSKRSF
jgi:hypothetical protein